MSPEDLNEPEFLGRDREVKQLREMYAAAKKGHKRCAILAGPKGVGKTRLFSVFKEQEMSSAHPVFLADFTDETMPELRAFPIFVALAAMVRKYGKLPTEVTESDALIEVDLSMMEFLLSNFRGQPEDDVLGNIHGTEDQFWSAMTQLIVEHAKRHPVNLWFEGLEKADTSSVRFLEFFHCVPEEKGAHIFTVGTYRDDDDSPGNYFAKCFPRVRRSDNVELINVQPLLSRSVPSFLASVVGQLKADDKVFNEAYKLTKGNPELLLSFVEGLAEKGVIVRQGTGWTIDSERADLSALPKEIEDQLLAGAKRLGKKHRDAIQWASVIGDEFDMAQIATLTGVQGTHLQFVVTDMCRDRYWDEIEGHKPRRFTFPSPRVRKTIYEDIKERQRKKMHLKVAAELEKKTPPPAASLAAHYRLGENVKKEHHWALAAAQAAYRQTRWQTCEEHVRRVIELLGAQKKPNPAELAEGQLWLARALRRRREMANADMAIKEGLRQAALVKRGYTFSPELKAEHALMRYARRDFKAYEAIKACLDGGPPTSENPELVTTMANLVRLRNRTKKAAEWLSSVVSDSEDFPPAEGLYRLTEGRLKFLEGDWAAADEAFTRAEELCREQRDFGLLAQALHELARLREIQGHIPEALNLVTSGVQYAEDYKDPAIEARLRALASRLLQKHGDGEEGFAELKKARKLAKKAQQARITAYVQLEVCRFYVHMKSFDKGLEAGRVALEQFETLKDRWGGAGCYYALGRLYQRAGNLQQAHKYYKFAVEYYRELGASWMGAFIAPNWANVAAKAGKPDRQKRLLKEGLEFARKFAMPEAIAINLLERGRAVADPVKAAEWSKEAHDLLREAGNRMEAKRARVLFKREKAAVEGDGEAEEAEEAEGAEEAAPEKPAEPTIEEQAAKALAASLASPESAPAVSAPEEGVIEESGAAPVEGVIEESVASDVDSDAEAGVIEESEVADVESGVIEESEVTDID